MQTHLKTSFSPCFNFSKTDLRYFQTARSVVWCWWWELAPDLCWFTLWNIGSGNHYCLDCFQLTSQVLQLSSIKMKLLPSSFPVVALQHRHNKWQNLKFHSPNILHPFAGDKGLEFPTSSGLLISSGRNLFSCAGSNCLQQHIWHLLLFVLSEHCLSVK